MNRYNLTVMFDRGPPGAKMIVRLRVEAEGPHASQWEIDPAYTTAPLTDRQRVAILALLVTYGVPRVGAALYGHEGFPIIALWRDPDGAF